MKAKTNFMEVLERLHVRDDERYGQIINNALQIKYGRKPIVMKGNEPVNAGAEYDTYYIEDEEFTEILLDYERFLSASEEERQKRWNKNGND